MVLFCCCRIYFRYSIILLLYILGIVLFCCRIYFRYGIILLSFILGMVLGQGAFGRVIKAEAIGIQEHEDVTVVAVKMVKGRSKVVCQK
jgi:hypothetical protein